jgi:hypothetical protein
MFFLILNVVRSLNVIKSLNHVIHQNLAVASLDRLDQKDHRVQKEYKALVDIMDQKDHLD